MYMFKAHLRAFFESQYWLKRWNPRILICLKVDYPFTILMIHFPIINHCNTTFTNNPNPYSNINLWCCIPYHHEGNIPNPMTDFQIIYYHINLSAISYHMFLSYWYHSPHDFLKSIHVFMFQIYMIHPCIISPSSFSLQDEFSHHVGTLYQFTNL